MQKSIIFFAVAAIFIVNAEALHHVESGEDFDEQVKNAGNKLVVVDFFATWCSPCKRVEPHLERFAQIYAGKIEVLKVDVDKLDELAAQYGVKTMPTFAFLKNGNVADQFFGAIPEAVEESIKQLLGLEQAEKSDNAGSIRSL